MNNIANAVRLLVAMGGIASAPGLKSGLGVYDAIRKVASRPPKSVANMATDLTRAAETVFKGFRDAPQDADVRFLQMVEIGLLDPGEITAAGMDPVACADAMLAKITDDTDPTGELRRADTQDLFLAIVSPTLAPLLRTKEHAADLTPAYMADMLQTAHRMEDKIDSVSDRLNHLEAQTRDTLEALALRFGEPEPEAMTLKDLRAFLIGKARDYRALKAEVKALRGTSQRIDTVLSGVDTAITDLDLEEADRLLSTIREATNDALRKLLEDNAKVMEAQARVAFLRGDPQEAKNLLVTAANSFAVVDAAESHRRKFEAARQVHAHGSTYGGSAIEDAIDLAESAIPEAMGALPIGELFAMNHDYATMLDAQGRMLAGQAATDCFDRAAEVYGFLLKTLEIDGGNEATRAAVITSLASVLTERALREPGGPTEAHLKDAERHLVEAIEILDVETDRANWLAAKTGLASTLRHLASTDPEKEHTYLVQAADALEDVETYLSREDTPDEWRINRYNQANILTRVAVYLEGASRRNLLQTAFRYYTEALELLSPEDNPIDWSSTLFGRALCLSLMGNAGGEEGLSAMRSAIADLQQVLEIQQKTGSAYPASQTLVTIAAVLESMADMENCPEPLAELKKAEQFLELAINSFKDAEVEADLEEESLALERVRSKRAALE
ncbi:hypothetical protein ABVF61_16625 [Roseibium sp. HPY-6]|uniref:hypothetical protein n=1 Tax=Roseibium sp. HPY-6 TaxID=3229852 RepID=UPI00338F3DD2